MEISAGEKRRERKGRYKAKLEQLLVEYHNVLIVGVDNVGSSQMQKIRLALRGKAVLILGKNTMMRMVVREAIASLPQLESLLPFIVGNVGLVFTNQELNSVRGLIVNNKVPACAKSGTSAPVDVYVPPGPTGLDPGQTSFFQALNIATKIVKGTIEIINQVHLIKKGDRVSSSAVALLSKLDIKPFFYGVIVLHVYENGSVYPVSILDISQEELMGRFLSGVRRIAALGLVTGYPTAASVSFSLANGFKKLLCASLGSGYTFKECDAILAAAAAAPVAAPKAASKAESKEETKSKHKEEPKEEEEEEDVGGGFGGLFGGDD